VKLIAYVPPGDHVDIRPAPVEREWMEETDQRYAYRCLPLNIANAFGWEILCPSGFTAVWDGGKGIPSLQVHPDGGAPAPAVSHFMQGILTFHVRCLFRTEPGYDLMVQGPINRPKDGIASLAHGGDPAQKADSTVGQNWIPAYAGMNGRLGGWKPAKPGRAACCRSVVALIPTGPYGKAPLLHHHRDCLSQWAAAYRPRL